MPSVKMLAIISMILFACESSKPKEPTPSKAVEDMTGITTIKQGEQMKKRIKELEKKQEERMKEFDSLK